MINYNNLTEKEKQEMRKAVLNEEKQREQSRKNQINEYKNMVDEAVLKAFEKIIRVSNILRELKIETFEDFTAILEMKQELYGVKENQQSHTFTTRDNQVSITIGHRTLDNFDDTVHAGIAKVKEYITKLTSEEKPELEKLIDLLLKKDKNGNLKASRVLELEAIASESNDVEFIDGVRIIKEAYKPVKSSTYIEAYYRDEQGNKINVPLSVTGVEHGKNKEGTN